MRQLSAQSDAVLADYRTHEKHQLIASLRDRASLLAIQLVISSEKDDAEGREVAARKTAEDAEKAKQKCQRLTRVQAVFTGAVALKPAPYGITYITLANLLAPLFFPSCDAPTPQATPNKIVSPATRQLQLQLDQANAQLAGELQP